MDYKKVTEDLVKWVGDYAKNWCKRIYLWTFWWN